MQSAKSSNTSRRGVGAAPAHFALPQARKFGALPA